MIELARPVDREAVERLARQVHEMHVSWRPDIYRMPEELFPEEQFAQLIAGRELYVAKLNGIVVGYAMMKIRTADRPDMVPRKVMLIDQICVDQALQRHGIGTSIMQDIHALARAFGCTDMQLGVYPQNDGAVAFYQKCGFMIQSISMQRKV